MQPPEGEEAQGDARPDEPGIGVLGDQAGEGAQAQQDSASNQTEEQSFEQVAASRHLEGPQAPFTTARHRPQHLTAAQQGPGRAGHHQGGQHGVGRGGEPSSGKGRGEIGGPHQADELAGRGRVQGRREGHPRPAKIIQSRQQTAGQPQTGQQPGPPHEQPGDAHGAQEPAAGEAQHQAGLIPLLLGAQSPAVQGAVQSLGAAGIFQEGGAAHLTFLISHHGGFVQPGQLDIHVGQIGQPA